MVAELRKLDHRTAGELRRIDRAVTRIEDTAAWQRVHRLTDRGHLSVVADRADLAEQTFGEIRSIAIRRLRQLEDNGGSAA